MIITNYYLTLTSNPNTRSRRGSKSKPVDLDQLSKLLCNPNTNSKPSPDPNTNPKPSPDPNPNPNPITRSRRGSKSKLVDLDQLSSALGGLQREEIESIGDGLGLGLGLGLG
jgi:hypothetical protein